MITKEEIKSLISKAKKSLAIKTVKYWLKATFGSPSKKQLEQLRLMQFYIKILECFELVGETKECECTVNGNYTFELVEGLESTLSPIQFNSDNTGYMYYNEVGYPFTYYYDPSNTRLVIIFNTLDDLTITFNNVTFIEGCVITNNSSTTSPIELAYIEVTGTPVPLSGYDGTLVILDGSLNPVYTLDIPNSFLDNPNLIIELWETEFGNTGFILEYIDGEYVFRSPFDDQNYFGWTAQFNQIEGGSDSYTELTNPLPDPFVTETLAAVTNQVIPTTQFSGVVAQTNEFEIPDAFLTIDETIITCFYLGVPITDKDAPITLADFIIYFNESNTENFVMEIGPSGGNNVIIKAPGPSDIYNGEAISFDNTDSVIFGTFTGGVSVTPGNITVTDETGGLIYIKNSTSFNTIQDFVDDFNLNNTGGMSAITDGVVGSNTRVKYTAPVGTGFEYNGTTLVYDFFGTGYSDTSFWVSGISTTQGAFTVNLLDTFGSPVAVLYADTELVNYSSYSEMIAAFNNSLTNMGFSVELIGDTFKFISPLYSFETYNDYQLEFIYIYDSPEYLDVQTIEDFKFGENPTLVPYEGVFAPTGYISDFRPDKPCEPEVVQLTCLTNENIESIYNHLKQMC